jgi:hypothetical protein
VLQRFAFSSGAITESTKDPTSGSAEGNPVENFVDAAMPKVASVLTNYGQYSRPGAAECLADAERWAKGWLEQLDQSHGEESESSRLDVPEVESWNTLRDALNAVWLCRIQSNEPDVVTSIAKSGYWLCKKIIETGGLRLPHRGGTGRGEYEVGRAPRQDQLKTPRQVR